MPERDIYENGPSRNGPLTTTYTDGNGQYGGKQNLRWNSKTKKIQSNRHEILLGQRHNTTKSFPHIKGGGKEKSGGLCHKTPLNLAPQNDETKIFKSNKKRHRKLKIAAKWDRKRVFWNYQSRGNPKNG